MSDSTLAIIAIAISVLSLVVSAYSAGQYHRQAVSLEEQVSIAREQWDIEQQERLAREALAREKATAHKRALVQVRAVRAGNAHRVRVLNRGPAVARDVRLAFLEALDGMPVPKELDNHLSAGTLAPGDTREYGIVSAASSRHYLLRVSWADDESLKTANIELIVPSSG